MQQSVGSCEDMAHTSIMWMWFNNLKFWTLYSDIFLYAQFFKFQSILNMAFGFWMKLFSFSDWPLSIGGYSLSRQWIQYCPKYGNLRHLSPKLCLSFEIQHFIPWWFWFVVGHKCKASWGTNEVWLYQSVNDRIILEVNIVLRPSIL